MACECAHHLDAEAFNAMLDRLAHELRSPLMELARNLEPPTLVVDAAGEVTFDTWTWGDSDTRSLPQGSPNRRRITLVNAGATVITLGLGDTVQAGAAGTFALIAGTSVTLQTNQRVNVSAGPGAVLSFMMLEVVA